MPIPWVITKGKTNGKKTYFFLRTGAGRRLPLACRQQSQAFGADRVGEKSAGRQRRDGSSGNSDPDRRIAGISV